MEIRKALEIAETEEKDLIAISAGETSNWFKFNMILKKSKEGLGNGCSLAVNKKTGKCEWKPVFVNNDDDYNYGFIKIYDEDALDNIRNLKSE